MDGPSARMELYLRKLRRNFFYKTLYLIGMPFVYSSVKLPPRPQGRPAAMQQPAACKAAASRRADATQCSLGRAGHVGERYCKFFALPEL